MKPRVLIVDDCPDVVELADYRLRGEGFEVVCAANGLDALRRARCEAPDVIVLDIMLPDVDGHVVAEILSVQPSTRDIPVVVFSALEPPPVKRCGTRQLYYQWVNKAREISYLAQSVRDALNESLSRRRSRVEAGPPRITVLED